MIQILVCPICPQSTPTNTFFGSLLLGSIVQKNAGSGSDHSFPPPPLFRQAIKPDPRVPRKSNQRDSNNTVRPHISGIMHPAASIIPLQNSHRKASVVSSARPPTNKSVDPSLGADQPTPHFFVPTYIPSTRQTFRQVSKVRLLWFLVYIDPSDSLLLLLSFNISTISLSPTQNPHPPPKCPTSSVSTAAPRSME
jgi:hypothetical protein